MAGEGVAHRLAVVLCVAKSDVTVAVDAVGLWLALPAERGFSRVAYSFADNGDPRRSFVLMVVADLSCTFPDEPISRREQSVVLVEGVRYATSVCARVASPWDSPRGMALVEIGENEPYRESSLRWSAWLDQLWGQQLTVGLVGILPLSSEKFDEFLSPGGKTDLIPIWPFVPIRVN